MHIPVDNRVVRFFLSQAKTRLIEAALMVSFLAIAALAAFLAVTVFSAKTAHAAGGYVTADASYTLSGSDLTFEVLAGSSYDSLTVGDRDFTLVLGDGDTAFLRRPETSRGKLLNNAGLDDCRYVDGKNMLWVTGPRTVIFEPTTHTCDSTDASKAYALEIGAPDGGQVLKEGDQVLILWQSLGSALGSADILLSTDGGNTYAETIAEGVITAGYYSWTVPLLTTTEHARVMVRAADSGQIVAADVSDADFTINGLEPPPPPPPPTPFDPGAVTFAANNIGNDLGLEHDQTLYAAGTFLCTPETRIKGASSSAVYYCGRDHKRHAFPHQRIHDTWYGSFAGVVELTDAELAQVPLGANVTYRPGARMIKIQTDPKVYAVGPGGELRWVSSEAVAVRLYGADWNTMIDDVSDAFFTDYSIGEAIE